MATRTAKGTTSAKASGTDLTLSSVAIASNACLLVGLGFDQAQGLPDVKFGNVSLQKVRSRVDDTSGIGTAIFIKPKIWDGRTADIVATWGSAIGARSMVAIEWDGPCIEDIGRNNIQVATGTPNSLLTGTPNHDHVFNWCIHASAGPSEDTTGSIEGTYGYSEGQRVGTTGGGLDVTIQETYRHYTSGAVDSRSRMTGATERTWVSCICVLRDHTQFRQGVTPCDIIMCQEAFELSTLDSDNMVFSFNEALDRWEVFDVSRSSLPSPIAHNKNGWDVP